MNVRRFCAAILAAALAACGGGGGGGSTSGTSTTSVACPDGSSATSAATCPAVSAPNGAQSTTVGTIKVSFTGTLASATAVLWKGAVGGTPVAGASSLSSDLKIVTFTPTVRIAYGDQQYTLVVTGTDSIGRTVQTTSSFSPGPMVCANNEVWSNPATFVSAYQACVAPIAVQTKMDPVIHKMTDTSCTLTVGAPLSAACKLYASNGTLMFANTGVTVGGKAMVWIAWFGQDGSSNLALVDAATLAVAASTVLANPLVWMIGNPTGVNIDVRVGAVLRNEQVTLTGTTLVVTCRVNCS